MNLKDLGRLLLTGAAAYATPSKVDDIAVAMQLVSGGVELLKKIHAKNLEKKQAHLDAAIEHNLQAKAAGNKAAAAKELAEALTLTPPPSEG